MKEKNNISTDGETNRKETTTDVTHRENKKSSKHETIKQLGTINKGKKYRLKNEFLAKIDY